MLGIDRESTEELIRERLNDEEKIRFTFLNSSFEDLNELPICDLLVSNFALPFCNPNHFQNLWRIICNSINPNGYFLGNFFGIEDAWNGKKKLMTFIDIDKVKSLFREFEMLEINEKVYDAKTGMGVMKHWDVINVFAKKK